MDLFDRLRLVPPPRVPPVDRTALREQMTREDPDFARVREIHHAARQPLTAKGIQDGMAMRAERQFWERNHPQ